MGTGEKSWNWEKNGKVLFYVFAYPCPFDSNAHVFVTCGLSTHRLSIVGDDGRQVRREFPICADSGNNMNVLAALLIAVGMNALDAYATRPWYSVMPGSGPVLSGGNPVYEHLYLSKPIGFPAAVAKCEQLMPAVEIAQIIPISERERKHISMSGGQILERRFMNDPEELLRFDRRREYAS